MIVGGAPGAVKEHSTGVNWGQLGLTGVQFFFKSVRGSREDGGGASKDVSYAEDLWRMLKMTRELLQSSLPTTLSSPGGSVNAALLFVADSFYK